MFCSLWKIASSLFCMQMISAPFVNNERAPSPEVQRQIDYINSVQNSWTAGYNYLLDLSENEIKRRLGTKSLRKRGPPGDTFWSGTEKDVVGSKKRLPKNFDARKAWPNCSCITQIRDQSNCGSCWAVAVSSTFTDRLCIASQQTINDILSAEDLLTCCNECVGEDGDGCNGGYVDEAWMYVNTHGISTGGDYNSGGCKPYSTPPCEPSKTNDCADGKASQCSTQCTNKNYSVPYEKDKNCGDVPRSIPQKDVIEEIKKNGSVTATFSVYQDFLSYTKGVYAHLLGRYLGEHAVRVIGWGTENSQAYWLAANSWNETWGDKGTFKIHRYLNGCFFGDFMASSPSPCNSTNSTYSEN